MRARIRSSFDQSSRDEEHFGSTIDPRIYHVRLIREHLGAVGGKRVLDLGCGKGRFARALLEQDPEAELWRLDISDEMLRFVPTGVRTRVGSMTDLPFENDFSTALTPPSRLNMRLKLKGPSLRSAAL